MTSRINIPLKEKQVAKKKPKSPTRRLRRQEHWAEANKQIDLAIAARNEQAQA